MMATDHREADRRLTPPQNGLLRIRDFTELVFLSDVQQFAHDDLDDDSFLLPNKTFHVI